MPWTMPLAGHHRGSRNRASACLRHSSSSCRCRRGRRRTIRGGNYPVPPDHPDAFGLINLSAAALGGKVYLSRPQQLSDQRWTLSCFRWNGGSSVLHGPLTTPEPRRSLAGASPETPRSTSNPGIEVLRRGSGVYRATVWCRVGGTGGQRLVFLGEPGRVSRGHRDAGNRQIASGWA